MTGSLFLAGRFASSSEGGGQEGAQQQTVNFALGQRQGMPLSLYFAQRKLLVNSTESFRIFCAALALLQVRTHFKQKDIAIQLKNIDMLLAI